MANRTRSAIVVGFLVPALACTAVTGLGKSYQYIEDGGTGGGDASNADSAGGSDGAKGEAATGIMCPALISGAYTLNDSGDCGAFDKNVRECVTTTTSVVSGNCGLQFASLGLGMAVKGALEAQPDGTTFRNGTVVVGGISHMYCVGTWDGARTLTLTCPSETGGNTCVVTMTRTVLGCM